MYIRKILCAFIVATLLSLLLISCGGEKQPNLSRTYLEYYNMSESEQIEHYESFSDPTDFLAWYNRVKEAYEKEQDRIEIGEGGSVDIGAGN